MRSIKADIWVLTESRTSVSPGDEFTLIAHTRRDGADSPDECWVAIWSRVGGDSLPTADGDRSAAVELAAGSAAPLVVFGTVLPWLGSSWRDIAASGAQAYSASLSNQASDWRGYRVAVPARRLCIAGDLNQDVLSTGHYYGSKLGRAALRAALVAESLVCPTAHPADAVGLHTEGLAAGIDHICVSDDLVEPSAPVQVWPHASELGSALTDHFGVCIALAAS